MQAPTTFLPRKGNYRDLLVYQKAECIYDITFHFTGRFLSKGDRTIDQMVQAARSGKQNIAEGCAASSTSSETELKLTNVARASMQELLVDYEDYLRVRSLPQWLPDDTRTRQVQAYSVRHNSPQDYLRDIDQRSDEAIANIAITLIHQFDHMMGKYIARLEKDFTEQGGIRERMTAARLGYRGGQKAEIDRLLHENEALRTRITELERQLEEKKGGAQ
ncbi:MAG: four helix bundle suffix domain-containing protein [Bacteroidaceae bacterium]|nr:four helix bundle suffix domain-containing protein [Bacteroidaceae bacterium]